MAERRMFSKTIVESDAFMDMPLSAQALYFHLGMAADDHGFVNNPKTVRRFCGASEDDLKLLVAKKFLLAFDCGVVLIKHWKINNWIRADRRHRSRYENLLEDVYLDDNASYTFDPDGNVPALESVKPQAEEFSCQTGDNQVTTNCQTSDNQLSDNCQSGDIPLPATCHTEVRLGKVRLEEDSYSSLVDTSTNLQEGVSSGGGLGEDAPGGCASAEPARKKAGKIKHRYGENRKVMLTDDELERLKQRFPADFSNRIDRLDWYIASTGKSYKSHYATIVNWARKDAERNSKPKRKLDQAVLAAMDSVM